MNPVIFVPLVALLPLAGSFMTPMMTMVGMGLAGAALIGMLILNPGGQLFVAAQAPLVALVSWMSFVLARRQVDSSGTSEAVAQSTEFQRMRGRHQTLKADVVTIEREESLSLQIYGVAKSLAEALSWADMAPRLTAGIQRVFSAHEFLLYALTEEGNWTLLHRRGAWSREFPVTGPLPVQSSFLYPPATSEVVPVLVVPIYVMAQGGMHMNGVLFLKANTPALSEKELCSVGTEFGQQLGMALSKALLFSKMENHSRYDGLTSVLRRQPFMDRLNEEFKKARVFRTPFSVAMVDIDHFKGVNDAHGHAAGDAVLKQVAELLKQAIYETDAVGRYGGEEFILLMSKAQPDGVRRKMESLRQKIESEIIPCGFEQLKVTVSIGLAHFPAQGRTGEELIAGADKALYGAKENGRNRVVEAS